jgi:hypothetical protein
MHGPITNPGAHLGQTFDVGIRVGLCRAISSFIIETVCKIHPSSDRQCDEISALAIEKLNIDRLNCDEKKIREN